MQSPATLIISIHTNLLIISCTSGTSLSASEYCRESIPGQQTGNVSHTHIHTCTHAQKGLVLHHHKEPGFNMNIFGIHCRYYLFICYFLLCSFCQALWQEMFAQWWENNNCTLQPEVTGYLGKQKNQKEQNWLFTF